VSRGDAVDGLVMRASVPVGARSAGQPDGMLLVDLPVGEGDPLRRLADIHQATAVLKARLRAGGGDVLDVLQRPLPAARLAVRWMRRIAGGRPNLFVTNVPGPDQPLWLAGARLLEAVPVAPLAHGVPLGVAALSYTGTLCVGINADAAIDDIDVLAAGVQRSSAALVEVASAGDPLPAAPVVAGNPSAARRVIENHIVSLLCGTSRRPYTTSCARTSPRPAFLRARRSPVTCPTGRRCGGCCRRLKERIFSSWGPGRRAASRGCCSARSAISALNASCPVTVVRRGTGTEHSWLASMRMSPDRHGATSGRRPHGRRHGDHGLVVGGPGRRERPAR
jgi:hypothetical protein